MRQIRIYCFSLLFLISTTCTQKVKEPDNSLTIEEYMALGVTDPNNAWNLDDYARTFSVLFRLKQNEPLSLPKKESEKSGLLYSRMTNLENLSFLNNDSLPLSNKAHQIKEFLNVYYNLSDVYTNILLKEPYYHRELMGINLFGLSISHKMVDLAKKINRSEEQSDIVMQSGYESIVGLYTNFLSNLLQSQSDLSMYSQQDLELLSDSLTSSIGNHWQDIDSGNQNNILVTARAIADTTQIPHVQQNYTHLVDHLSTKSTPPGL